MSTTAAVAVPKTRVRPLVAPTSYIFSAWMYAGSSAPPSLGAEVETPLRAATRAGACAAARRAKFRRALDIV